MILKKIPVDQDKAARKSKATNISDLTAVSYTHLDVYKRQV